MKIDTAVKFVLTFVKVHKASSLGGLFWFFVKPSLPCLEEALNSIEAMQRIRKKAGIADLFVKAK
jgi:hypothetical protein